MAALDMDTEVEGVVLVHAFEEVPAISEIVAMPGGFTGGFVGDLDHLVGASEQASGGVFSSKFRQFGSPVL